MGCKEVVTDQLSREHVTFIALGGNCAPHFTTITHFVITRQLDIAHVFAAIDAPDRHTRGLPRRGRPAYALSTTSRVQHPSAEATTRGSAPDPCDTCTRSESDHLAAAR